MLELIKFLAGSKGLLKRVGILVAICFLAIAIDTFTSFPSLNFEENRYNIIEKMAVVHNDTTIPTFVRNAAKERMISLSERHSLHEHLHNFFTNSRNALKRISRMVQIGNYILTIFLNWVIYVIASSGYFISMYYRAIKSFGQMNFPQKIKKQILFLGVTMLILTLVIPFLIITVFEIASNLLLTILLCQATVAIGYFTFMFLPMHIDTITYTEDEIDENDETVSESSQQNPTL